MRKLIYFITLLGIIFISSNAIADHWFAEPFVDSFGDPQEKQYIHYDSIGVFSNHVTNGRVLYANIVVSHHGRVGFYLQEYSRRHEAASFSDGYVMMKNSEDEVLIIEEVFPWGRKSGIEVGSYAAKAIIGFLKESIGTVKVIVGERRHSKYRFDINANGFTASYNFIRK